MEEEIDILMEILNIGKTSKEIETMALRDTGKVQNMKGEDMMGNGEGLIQILGMDLRVKVIGTGVHRQAMGNNLPFRVFILPSIITLLLSVDMIQIGGMVTLVLSKIWLVTLIIAVQTGEEVLIVHFMPEVAKVFLIMRGGAGVVPEVVGEMEMLDSRAEQSPRTSHHQTVIHQMILMD